MATISKSWAAQQQILGGSGDSWTTMATGTAENLSDNVDLETDGYEGAHVLVEVDGPATPTDYVDVSIFAALNASDYDDYALFSQRIERSSVAKQISLIVKDVAHFKVGVKHSGGTDSYLARVYCQRWRWQSA
jgi:hypothetical protein